MLIKCNWPIENTGALVCRGIGRLSTPDRGLSHMVKIGRTAFRFSTGRGAGDRGPNQRSLAALSFALIAEGALLALAHDAGKPEPGGGYACLMLKAKRASDLNCGLFLEAKRVSLKCKNNAAPGRAVKCARSGGAFRVLPGYGALPTPTTPPSDQSECTPNWSLLIGPVCLGRLSLQVHDLTVHLYTSLLDFLSVLCGLGPSALGAPPRLGLYPRSRGVLNVLFVSYRRGRNRRREWHSEKFVELPR